MYSLNTYNTKTIHNLKHYMLNTIKNNSLEDISDKCNIVKTINSYNKQQNLDRISTFFIPKSNIYVNYNKLKSKYNEKPTYLKKKNLFLMINYFGVFINYIIILLIQIWNI